MSYAKKRYAEDPDFRNRIKASVKKYNQSKKGIAARKKAAESLKKRRPDYTKEYMKKRRIYANKHKLCIRCLKHPQMNGIKTCKKCRVKDKEKYARYRKGHTPEINRRLRDRRTRAKEQGICTTCFQKKARKGKTKCANCR